MRGNAVYAMAELPPGYFAFGTSGGDVLIAFKVDTENDGEVLAGAFGLPDSISPEDVFCIAPDFLTFAKALGRSSNP